MRKTTLIPAVVAAALACLGSTSWFGQSANAQVYVDGQSTGERIIGYANRAAYTRTGAARTHSPSAVDPYSGIQSRTSTNRNSQTDLNSIGQPAASGATATSAAASSIAMNSIATYGSSANTTTTTTTTNFYVDPWYTTRYGARHYYVYRPYPRYRYRSYYYGGYPYYRYYGRRYYGGYGRSYCGFNSGISFRLRFGDGYRGRSRSYHHRPYFDGYRYRQQSFRTSHRRYGNFIGYGTGGLSICLNF